MGSVLITPSEEYIVVSIIVQLNQQAESNVGETSS